MSAETSARSEKREISNNKRLESLRQKQSTWSQRQNAVKNALGNSVEGYSVNKRITFGDDNDVEEEYNKEDNSDEPEISGKSKNKHILFESDSEEEGKDEDDRFRIRPQYEGEYGQKLLKLQKKYGDDERFQFDARFAETNDQNGEGKEVSRGLQIHELVDVESEKTKKKKKFPGIRYDPTNSAHSRFELTSSRVETHQRPKLPERQKTKEDLAVRKDEDEQNETVKEAPVVSKERYYRITENITEAFKKDGKESFSILGLFGKQDPVEDGEDDEAVEQLTCEKLDRKKSATRNPFKYEDSTDEEEEEEIINKKTENLAVVHEDDKQVDVRPRCFFFGGKDLRSKEGTDDFCRSTSFKTIQKTFTENRSLLKRDFAKKRNLAVFLSKPKKRRLGDKHAQRATT